MRFTVGYSLAVLLAMPSTATSQYRTCGTRSTEACTAPGSPRFASISAGNTHTCALTPNGEAWCWGDGRTGALGDGVLQVQRWPQRVQTSEQFVEIGAGGAFTCARTQDGAVHCWGSERPVPGWPDVAATPVRVPTRIQATMLSVGRRHACFLDRERRAHCWGFNVDGETGTGTAGIEAAMIAAPTPVVGDHRFQSLSAGAGVTCGVRIDGIVLCWGSDIDGMIGPGATQRCADVGSVRCSTIPVAVESPHRWTSVSVGTRHACAMASTTEVFCWGSNDAGQAGVYDARHPVTAVPSRVDLSVKVSSVASGGIHTCAITDGARLFCWGADAWTFSDPRHYARELRPREPIRGVRFSAVSTGQVHVCALEVAGRARCWGDTIFGAFGVR